MSNKLQQLKKILSEMRSVLVAYSGGVDSTFLLKVAHDVLGNKLLAVTAESLTYPSSEINKARQMAAEIDVRHLIIKTEELSNPKFASNPLDRCYWCKEELFSKLAALAKKHNLGYVLDGSNYDDTKDFRPGTRAARDFGVRSPLKEAELGKEEIRNLSKKLGLPTWDKASLACLASRFPYGTNITKENLAIIDKAEEFLRSLGIKQVRVRHHDHIARIEVSREEISSLLQKKLRDRIVNKLKDLGYIYVTIDLEGYRTGSLNEISRKDLIKGG